MISRYFEEFSEENHRFRLFLFLNDFCQSDSCDSPFSELKEFAKSTNQKAASFANDQSQVWTLETLSPLCHIFAQDSFELG